LPDHGAPARVLFPDEAGKVCGRFQIDVDSLRRESCLELRGVEDSRRFGTNPAGTAENKSDNSASDPDSFKQNKKTAS